MLRSGAAPVAFLLQERSWRCRAQLLKVPSAFPILEIFRGLERVQPIALNVFNDIRLATKLPCHGQEFATPMTELKSIDA